MFCLILVNLILIDLKVFYYCRDLNHKYNIADMIKDDLIFCATGVSDGDLVKGIKNIGDSFESETYVLQKSSLTNKIVKNIIKK